MVNVAVLVSGGGTNLQAILDAQARGEIPNGRICAVISSREDAYALERAKQAQVPAMIMRRKDYESVQAYSDALESLLKDLDVQLVVLAGFMTVLAKSFCETFENRIINVHPALIPSFCGNGYYGLHVHEAALAKGVKVSGATVHFVNAITDGGPIISQKAVEVCEGDTPEILQKRIMEQAECRLLTYSAQGNHAALTAEHIGLFPDRVEFDAAYEGERASVTLGIPGIFSVYNALGVIAAALALDIPLAKIADALRTAQSVKGRVEVVPTPGKDYTVLIDYSHTPDSLENILRAVRGFCAGRIIAVFGCGGDRDPYKRPVMGKIAAELADLAIVTSDNPRTEDPYKILRQILAGMQDTETPYEVIESRVSAIFRAMELAQKDDVIVLCGKGHETYQEIGHEKHHLDEREVVASYLEAKA